MFIMETIQSWVFLLTLLAAAALGAKLLGDVMIRMDDVAKPENDTEAVHEESPVNIEFVRLLKSEADEPYDQYADLRP